ncbi:MAG: hypothetical protein SF097_14880 [Acidobacteriota bacterium]|nr:hypothetical protein [Acidobacteriota bacterium]
MNSEKNRFAVRAMALVIVLVFGFGAAFGQTVTGSGTANKITKWTGTNTVGNSGITEDATGNVGIGTSPISTIKVLMQSALTGTGATFRAVNTSSGRAIEGSSSSGIGVNAFSGSGNALTANSTSGYGIFTSSSSNYAIYATSASNNGVYGVSNSSNTTHAAIRGIGVTGGAFAGRFTGNVSVTGTLSKGGGSFKIDHPLDPENKYLYHSFVESPDMMNIYNGNIVTDENGVAVVELPEWFETLNRDFRYQLTVIGTFAQAIVAQKVSGNHFAIRTSEPGVEVSWQVTGIRQDPWANQNRIPTEELKPKDERGTYLHPEAANKPEELGLEWRRDPETMARIKAQRQKQQ